MRAHRSALVLLAGLGLCGAATGAEVRGRVVEVDLAKKQVQLARPVPRGGPTLLLVDADTRVLFGKKAADVADVPKGRRVRIFYEESDGKAVAKVIRVPGRRPARPAPPPAGPPPKGTGVTGTLRRVAYTERELVVVGPGPKGAETETIVRVPEKVRPTRDGKAISFNDLREGEQATVFVERRDGRAVATAIQIGAAPAARPRSDILRRVRLGLRLAERVLEQMDRPKK
jgi:hypothetical protein